MVNIKNMLMVFLVLAVVFIAGCASEPTDDVNDNNDVSSEGISGDEDTTPITDNVEEPDAPSLPTGQVVATVNGEDVMSDEVLQIQQTFMQQGQEIPQEDAINQVISQVVVAQKAQAEGFVISTEEAESIIETQLSQQGMSLDDYKERLVTQGISYDDELENIKVQLANQEYVDSVLEDENFEVTTEEAEQFYAIYTEQSSEEVPPYDELESQIFLQLEQQKQQEFLNVFIQSLMDNATIEYK